MNELKAFKINVDPANVLFFSQRNFYTWNMDSKDCAIWGNGLKSKRMENTLRGCTHQYSGAAQRLQKEVKLRKSPNRRKSTVCLGVKPLSAGQHSFHRLFHQTPQFFWGTFINIVLFSIWDATCVLSFASHTNASKSPLLFLAPPHGLSRSRSHFPLVSLTLPADHSKSSCGPGQKLHRCGERWHWELLQHRHPVPAGWWSFLWGPEAEKGG